MAAILESINTTITSIEESMEAPGFKHVSTCFKKHYKDVSLWTLNTGCIVYTLLIIYHLLSSRQATALDFVIISFFIVGALAYVGTSKLFQKMNKMFEDNVFVSLANVVNKYFFVGLSLVPGMYFAFKYEDSILNLYLVVHIVTMVYFFYKRFKDFELVPFLIGLGMSIAVGSIGVSIRYIFGIFGSGWFPTFLASSLETLFDLSLAIAFMLRLPERHLPTSMIFGLKVVKYLMFLFSWKTFFILMVFVSWRNIGAAAWTVQELYTVIPEEDDKNDKKESLKNTKTN